MGFLKRCPITEFYKHFEASLFIKLDLLACINEFFRNKYQL